MLERQIRLATHAVMPPGWVHKVPLLWNKVVVQSTRRRSGEEQGLVGKQSPFAQISKNKSQSCPGMGVAQHDAADMSEPESTGQVPAARPHEHHLMECNQKPSVTYGLSLSKDTYAAE